MQTKNVVLIHGWSADSQSMEKLAAYLATEGYNAIEISLGDYQSLYDDVLVEDVAIRMESVMSGRQDLMDEGFHLIVHSTGALVARQWIANRFERGEKTPVENFLMLAPANHGSPVATLGRSALGRIAKFSFKRGFQSGTEMLHALELGSDFQEQLDLRDRLSTDGQTDSPYAVGAIRPYVMVGAQPMDSASILNQNGWDGTVRIAGSNFDPRGVTLKFSDDPKQPEVTGWTVRGRKKSAFAVLPDRSHISILDPDPKASLSDDPPTARLVRELVLQAISVNSEAEYDLVMDRFDGVTALSKSLAHNSEEGKQLREKILRKRGDRIAERYNQFYQIVVDVSDDVKRNVGDYFVWLSAPTQSESAHGLKLTGELSAAEIMAHRDVLRHVHVNRRNSERRVLHMDRYKLLGRDGFFNELDYRREKLLVAGITAMAPGDMISYFEKGADASMGYVTLRAQEPGESYASDDRFLKHYATHYIRVIIPRAADDSVFRLERFSDR